MIYIVKYTDVQLAIFEIKKKYLNLEKENIKIIDFKMNENFMLDIQQINLFNKIDVFVIINCTFLSKTNTFNEMQSIFNDLNNVIDKDIYLLTEEKILSNKEFKNLTKNFKFLEINEINDKNKKEFINYLLNKHNIVLDKDIYALLLNNLNNNYGVITNEINKLSHLMLEETSKDNLRNVISNYNDENVFKLVENILLKKQNQVWIIYNDLVNKKNDEIMIINAIASQLTKIFFILKMLKDNIAINDIASLTKVPSYFIMNYQKFFNHLNIKTLKEKINSLYELELQIKLNKIDKKLALKEMIINWLTN